MWLLTPEGDAAVQALANAVQALAIVHGMGVFVFAVAALLAAMLWLIRGRTR